MNGENSHATTNISGYVPNISGDVQAATQHFVSYGYGEGRPTFFDAQSYIAANLDLLGAFGMNVRLGAEHYVSFGFHEGRASGLSGVKRIGDAGPESLVGTSGNDLLDGMGGADSLTGGAERDIFVLRNGDGGQTLQAADVITDFNIGEDLLGLSGLGFDQLQISQGTGANAPNTIGRSLSGEYLAILNNLLASELSSNNFVGF